MITVSVSPADFEDIYGMAGFIPAHQYMAVDSTVSEVGRVFGIRLVYDGPTTEFVTTDEFRVLMRKPNFVRETDIQGRIFDSTFISLVPPEAP